MTPSSRIALGAACVLLVAGALMYARSQDTRAPVLSRSVVERLLARGARGVEQRNATQVLELTTDDARLFGLRREQLARVMGRARRDMGSGRLSISWNNVTVVERGNVGTAEFDVTVREHLNGADAVYMTMRVTLDLVKVRRSNWLGLGSSEHWLVRRAESSTDLMLGE